MSRSSLDLVFSRFCIFCAYTRPRYQVSVYRTIGPLVSFFDENNSSKRNSPMGRRVLRRHFWGYSVCLCPIKRTPGLYGLSAFGLFVRLIALLLCVHDKQLRSCRDGHLFSPHCSSANLPEAVYQYLAYILSPLIDTISAFNVEL